MAIFCAYCGVVIGAGADPITDVFWGHRIDLHPLVDSESCAASWFRMSKDEKGRHMIRWRPRIQLPLLL